MALPAVGNLEIMIQYKGERASTIVNGPEIWDASSYQREKNHATTDLTALGLWIGTPSPPLFNVVKKSGLVICKFIGVHQHTMFYMKQKILQLPTSSVFAQMKHIFPEQRSCVDLSATQQALKILEEQKREQQSALQQAIAHRFAPSGAPNTPPTTAPPSASSTALNTPQTTIPPAVSFTNALQKPQTTAVRAFASVQKPAAAPSTIFASQPTTASPALVTGVSATSFDKPKPQFGVTSSLGAVRPSSAAKPAPSPAARPAPPTASQPATSSAAQPLPSTAAQSIPATAPRPVLAIATQPAAVAPAQPVPSTATQSVPSTKTRQLPSPSENSVSLSSSLAAPAAPPQDLTKHPGSSKLPAPATNASTVEVQISAATSSPAPSRSIPSQSSQPTASVTSRPSPQASVENVQPEAIAAGQHIQDQKRKRSASSDAEPDFEALSPKRPKLEDESKESTPISELTVCVPSESTTGDVPLPTPSIEDTGIRPSTVTKGAVDAGALRSTDFHDEIATLRQETHDLRMTVAALQEALRQRSESLKESKESMLLMQTQCQTKDKEMKQHLDTLEERRVRIEQLEAALAQERQRVRETQAATIQLRTVLQTTAIMGQSAAKELAEANAKHDKVVSTYVQEQKKYQDNRASFLRFRAQSAAELQEVRVESQAAVAHATQHAAQISRDSMETELANERVERARLEEALLQERRRREEAEKALEEEQQEAAHAQAVLAEIARESKTPYVVPALMEAFVKIVNLSSDTSLVA